MDQQAATPAPIRKPYRCGAKWLAMIFGSVSVILLLIAIVTAVSTARFVSAAAPAVAQVVSTEAIRVKGGWSHVTEFAVIAADGRRVTATHRSAEYYAPNDSVAVLYRADPTVEIIPAEREWLWSSSVALLAVGGAFLLVAGFAWMLHRTFRRPSPSP